MLQLDGTIHYYTDPLQVSSQMGNLIQFINDNLDSINPVILSSIAHYEFVKIHPFDDGNGRGARFLANMILVKKGFPTAIIKNENRRRYIDTLKKADDGEIVPFVDFVSDSLIETMKFFVDEGKR